ncbi:MAG: ABC transporter ATP-binding protein, partial [Candidatus Paceibacterota bacterium]
MSDKELDWGDSPEVSAQTTSYFIHGMKTLWDLIAVERKRVLWSILILVFVEGISLSIPLLFRELVDQVPIVLKEGITPFVMWSVFAMFAVRIVTLVIRRFVQEPVFLKAIIRLENFWPRMAQEKLLALSIGYHEKENTGRKIAKVNKGVEKLVNMLVDLFWGLIPALVYLLMNVVIILVLDWKLGLLFILPLIPAVWINLKSYKAFYPGWIDWDRKKEKSIGLFCQSIINIRTVQSFVSEKNEEAEHGGVREEMRALDLDICLKIQRYYFVMEMILGLFFLTTIVTGLYFVYRGWGTVGTVSYIFITGNATLQSLWNMIQIYTRLLRDLVSAERMQALLTQDVDVANEAPGVIPPGAIVGISFIDASIAYSGKKEPALDGVNLKMKPGQMFAFVGRSGSGKSTLVNILARVYDPTGGMVTVNGVNVRKLDRDWYRKRFAFVPQDVEVFDGTIRQNIAYACPGASDEWIEKAVKAACLDEVVGSPGRFPDGLKTQVGERGVRLSG